jgi:hypothetical protein
LEFESFFYPNFSRSTIPNTLLANLLFNSLFYIQKKKIFKYKSVLGRVIPCINVRLNACLFLVWLNIWNNS